MKRDLNEFYNIKSQDVGLEGFDTPSGKYLETFKSPGSVLVDFTFTEFTCLCPRTSHPDFADIQIVYIPTQDCVEEKALKYYLNSFRDEGHFHEAVIQLIYEDLKTLLNTPNLLVRGVFSTRGGIDTIIECGELQ